MKRGDILVAVDGVLMAGRPMHDVAAKLLGPPESIVRVTFRRPATKDAAAIENLLVLDRRLVPPDAIRKIAEDVYDPERNQ